MPIINPQQPFVRPASIDGDVIVKIAEGPDDPRASDTGRVLMKLFAERTDGTRMLKRSDFSPTDLKAGLTNIMITDVKYDENGLPVDAIIRLMGSALTIFYGEFTGKSVLDHPTESGERYMMDVRMAVETGCMIIGRAERATPDETFLKVISLVVPIADDGVHVNQTLALIQPYRRRNQPRGDSPDRALTVA